MIVARPHSDAVPRAGALRPEDRIPNNGRWTGVASPLLTNPAGASPAEISDMNRTRLAFASLALALATAPRAQGIAPGEEIVLGVSYLGVPTGEARMRVGQPEGDIWPVVFQARTSGAASLLDVREHLVSYWDAGLRLSRGSDLKAYEVGDYHTDSARFSRIPGEPTKVTVVEARRGKKPKTRIIEVPHGALDLTGAFLWLRMQELAVGARLEVPIISGTSQFTLTAEVVDREEVETPAGTFPSFKVRVRTAFKGKFSTKRDTFLWFADTHDRRLVKASAEFAVGSIVAELKSYRPGNAVAER